MKKSSIARHDSALLESSRFPHDRCYQALKRTSFQFERDNLYSYGSLERITGLDNGAYLKLAQNDRWPHAKVFHPHGIGKRTLLVKGDFLADLQEHLRSAGVIVYYPAVASDNPGLELSRQKEVVSDYLAEHGGEIVAAYREPLSDDGTAPVHRLHELRDAITTSMQSRTWLLVAAGAALSREAREMLRLSGIVFRIISPTDAEPSKEL